MLFAYAVGLPAIVLIRTQVASFQARGDTTTPMVVSLTAIACNIALKLLLWRDFGASGLALATAAGAWINVGLLFLLGVRRGWARPAKGLPALAAIVLVAAVLAGLTARLVALPLLALAQSMPWEPRLAALAGVGIAAIVVYGAVVALGLKAAGLVRLLR